VLSERIPSPLTSVLGKLDQCVGQDTVEETLDEVARAAIAFYRHGFPMAAALFAEPKLLAAYRETLRARGAGPQHAFLSHFTDQPDDAHTAKALVSALTGGI
jgi:hypothetical protein